MMGDFSYITKGDNFSLFPFESLTEKNIGEISIQAILKGREEPQEEWTIPLSVYVLHGPAL